MFVQKLQAQDHTGCIETVKGKKVEGNSVLIYISFFFFFLTIISNDLDILATFRKPCCQELKPDGKLWKRLNTYLKKK